MLFHFYPFDDGTTTGRNLRSFFYLFLISNAVLLNDVFAHQMLYGHEP